MIEFEHNMLVLNNIFSKEDVDHINAYTNYIRNEEQNRIIKLLETERWKLPDGTIADGEIYLPIEQAISLIKGENK